MKPEHLATIIKLNNIMGFLPIGLDEILPVVVQETGKLFPDQCVCLYLNQGEDFEVGPCACSCPSGAHCRAGRERPCPVVSDGLPVVVADAGREPGCGCQRAASYACTPIKSGGEILGIVSLSGREAKPFSREDLEVLLSLANQTGLAITAC